MTTKSEIWDHVLPVHHEDERCTECDRVRILKSDTFKYPEPSTLDYVGCVGALTAIIGALVFLGWWIGYVT